MDEELLFTESEKRYYEAKRLHEEKFGKPPYFQGLIDPSDERHIEMIYEALRTNKPVNEELPKNIKKIIRKGGVVLID